MSYIIENIYIGDKYDVINESFMRKNKISAVLNTAFELPRTPLAKDYLKLSMSDSRDELLYPNLVVAYSFLEKQQALGRNVIVHCSVGMSRSSSIVIGFLILKGMSFHSAYSLVKQQRPIIQPNEGFMKQLEQLETVKL